MSSVAGGVQWKPPPTRPPCTLPLDPLPSRSTACLTDRDCAARRAGDARPADDYSIGADNFFVVSPRLTAHANATHAAKLMAQHIAHHRKLGFSGHSVFLNRCAAASTPGCV